MIVRDDWEFEHWMFGDIKGTLIAFQVWKCHYYYYIKVCAYILEIHTEMLTNKITSWICLKNMRWDKWEGIWMKQDWPQMVNYRNWLIPKTRFTILSSSFSYIWNFLSETFFLIRRTFNHKSCPRKSALKAATPWCQHHVPCQEWVLDGWSGLVLCLDN